MREIEGPGDIETVLDEVKEAGGAKRTTVQQIVDEFGSDAYGPLLLVPALILVSPASGIPGMPTIGSLIISLISAQMLLGRREVWLPGFIRRRSISRKRMDQALSFLRKPAAIIDRLTRERLVFLTKPPFIELPALISALMILLAPAFEMVPFSVSIAAGAVSLFALAIVAKDGLMALLGLAVFGGAAYLLVSVLL